jgi:hypothetical protein
VARSTFCQCQQPAARQLFRRPLCPDVSALPGPCSASPVQVQKQSTAWTPPR